MKTRSTVGRFLLIPLIVVHGIASIRNDGERDGCLADCRNAQFNEFPSLESNDHSSDIELGDFNTADYDTDHKDLKTAKKNQCLPNYYNGSDEQLSHNPCNSDVSSQNGNDDQNRSDYDWSYNQSERSSMEPFGSGDGTGEQQGLPDGAYRITCPEFGRRMVEKIAALDEIVAAEQRRGSGNLLGVEDPLQVKKCALKVDKRTYVSFRAAGLRATGDVGAVLEYLSVDAAGDWVRADYAFDGLAGNGTFKTNAARGDKRGPYAVDMRHVRCNVTAHFHRGRHGASGTVSAARFAVSAPPGTAAANASVDARYRAAVDRSVVSAVLGATHGGLAARLKAELNAHDSLPPGRGGSATPCDPTGLAGTRGGRPLDSVSYTRLGRQAYRMRFDVRLAGPVRWTGHRADAASDGPGPSSVHLVADAVRIRVAVVRSVGRVHGCREIDAHVRIARLASPFNDQSDVPATVRLADIQRSITDRLRDSLKNTVCNGSVVNV